MEKKKRLCIAAGVLLVFLTLLRIGLFAKTPYYAIAAAFYDERNQIDAAASLLRGDRLGGYGNSTLIKGISFPLFLAFGQWLGVSYPVLLGCFTVMACFFCALGLFLMTRSRVLFAVSYVFLLYAPVTFLYAAQRIYRQALMYPAVLAVAGCVLIVYALRKGPKAAYIAALVLLGLLLSFFYYIREDSAWLLLFVVAALAIAAVWILFFSGQERKEKVLRMVLLSLPLMLLLLSTLGLKTINYRHYGVFLTNDRSDGHFADLAETLIRIEDPDNTDKDIWISGKTIQKAVEVSPTLNRDKERIYAFYGFPEEGAGDIRGDISVWTLRTLFAQLGYYESGAKSDQICKQINEELQAAVARGELTLDRKFHFTGLYRGLDKEEFPGFLKGAFMYFWRVNTYKPGAGEERADRLVSPGDEGDLRYIEGITGARLIRSNVTSTEIGGWIFLKGTEPRKLRIDLEDVDGNVLVKKIKREERPDVAEVYKDDVNALKCAFSVTLDGIYKFDRLRLAVYDGKQRIGAYPLDTNEDENIRMVMEVLRNNAEDAYYQYTERIVALSNGFLKAGHILQLVLFPLALVLWVLLIVRFFLRRTWEHFETAIILTGLVGIAFVYELALVMFSAWLGEGNLYFYSSSIPALMQPFELLALYSGVRFLVKRTSLRSGKGYDKIGKL